MKIKIVRWLSVTTAALFLALANSAVNAIPLSWQFSNVAFDDGGTLVGSFVFDADTSTYSNVAVTSTQGSAYAGVTYSPGSVVDIFGPHPTSLSFGGNTPFGNFGSQLLSLRFFSPLTNAGGEVELVPGDSWEGTENYSLCAIFPTTGCEFPDVLRRVASGSVITAPVTAVPAPFSLGLFCLGLFGLSVSRRQNA